MARTYKRDNRGRFASGGSTGGGSKGKTLKRGRAQLAEARGKMRTAKGKLAAMDPADQTIKSSLSKRAQRGAVTKAEKRLATVKRTAVIKTRRMTGTIGKPKGLKPGALKGKVAGGGKAQSASAIRNKARLDGDAFAARMKRAQGATLKRGLNESDRENSLTGAQRWSPAKRFEASNRRWAKTERTMAAAKQFYRNYGSPATFGLRQKQTTASSPSFGSKRRRSRRR